MGGSAIFGNDKEGGFVAARLIPATFRMGLKPLLDPSAGPFVKDLPLAKFSHGYGNGLR